MTMKTPLRRPVMNDAQGTIAGGAVVLLLLAGISLGWF
ncbi:hypothetical protein LDDCCGHA_4851 [Methylobacterium oxalidis]|nr:hypothetical protein LDDCCGHA_4851 [Methylobacterium oxalidis]